MNAREGSEGSIFERGEGGREEGREGGREGGRERVLHKKKSSNCATFTSTFQQA